MGLGEEIVYKGLGELHPDARNPRFPPEQREWESDDELLLYLADVFDAIAIAESVARHGYFSSEPMVVTEEDGRLIVLEGNRRLVALLGMARPDLREHFDEHERWEQAAAARPEVNLTFEVPVIEADNREDADAVIGFRHIGSLLAWKPVQRAQFLAYLIDTRGESFDGAAETVGEEVDAVRLLYRNQAIISRTRELGEPSAAANFTNRFGIFTAALNRNAILGHVGAKRASEVIERTKQLNDDALPAVVELASWLYGADGDDKVIRESREIRLLAEVVADDDALEELRRTRDLYAAHASLRPSGPPEPASVMRSLATGVGHLRTASASIEIIAHEERAQNLSEELTELASEIADAVDADGTQS